MRDDESRSPCRPAAVREVCDTIGQRLLSGASVAFTYGNPQLMSLPKYPAGVPHRAAAGT